MHTVVARRFFSRLYSIVGINTALEIVLVNRVRYGDMARAWR